VNAQNLKGNNYVLKMYDVLGKEVYSIQGNVFKDDKNGVVFEEINCATIAAGYYTIQLQPDQEKLVKKFIKQ